MDRVKLKVLGLSYSMAQAGAYALMLSNEDGSHRIPIVIGMPEAQSIAIQFEKIHTQRPLTHDLMKTLTDAMNVSLKEVFIYRLESGIFYSELLFQMDEKIIKIDARTSDAVALALRYECQIFSTPEIMEKAGILVDQENIHAEQEMVIPISICKMDNIQDCSIKELNWMLEEAVQNENYEKASEIRDVIKSKD